MARLRKISAILLALALVIGMVPVSFMFQTAGAEAANAIQVTNKGGSTQGTNFGLEISKIIEGTGIENYFDITLTAETTSVKTQESIDVVVVMDISNSVVSNYVAGDNGEITRLEAVKSSVYEFLNEYSTNTTLAKLDKRFGLVTFNSLAYNNTIKDTTETTTNGLLAVPGNGRAMGIYWSHVDPIKLPSVSEQDSYMASTKYWGDLNYDRVRFTNIEGGLQMAQNMLSGSTATYKYVVLITDGFPTTYIHNTAVPEGETNFDNRTNINEILGFNNFMSLAYPDAVYDPNFYDVDGYFMELSKDVRCERGCNYSNKGAIRAAEVAAAMKKSGINIFSIGVGVDNMSVGKEMAKTKENTYDTDGTTIIEAGDAVVDTNGMDNTSAANMEFEIGNTTDSYTKWLASKIGGGDLLADSDITYLNGNSQSQLHNDIGKILKAIEVAASGRMDSFYVVDPMSEDVEFLGFYDINGEFVALDTSSTLTGESKLDAENTASFGAEGYANTIYWDLMNSGFTSATSSEGNTTSVTYTFQLKYRVRLKSDAEGFEWNTAVATNDTTTLTYESTFYDVNGDATGETRKETIEFPIPEVQGFCGELSFVKVDDANNNAPLANVEFTLIHKGDDCAVCHGDATIGDYTVTTDANGEATISEIVSGHEYTLIETPPVGYGGAEDHAIEVAYGKVYIDGEPAPTDMDFIITNTKYAPVYVTLTAEKTLDGETPDEGAFSFNLSGTAQNGEVIDETVTNDAEGKITFSTLSFDEIGEYTFTIVEIQGDDKIHYDTVERVVTVKINLDNANECYTATISGDANATISGSGEASVGKFKNSTKTPVIVELQAEKIITDSEGNELTLNGEDFEFAIIDENGETVKTVKNDADGIIDLGSMTFNAAGTYIYYVSEIAGDDELISYDEAEYNIVIVVTEGETEFTADISYVLVNDEVDEITFTNIMNDPDATTVVIEGNKTLVGRDMADDEFEFVLTDKDGKIIETVSAKAAADGEKSGFAFGAITFTEEGTYNFTVYEKSGDLENVTYDETVYNVTVEVTYGGEGKLVADVTVDGNEYAPVEFVNEYIVIPEAGDNMNLWFYASIILAVLALGGFAISKRSRAF